MHDKTLISRFPIRHAFLALLAWGATSAQAALPTLFEARAPASVEARSTAPADAARQVVPKPRVLEALAQGSREGGYPAFGLELPDGRALVAEVTAGESMINGGTGIAFHFPGHALSFGAAASYGDAMLMDLRIDGEHYAMTRSADGSHVLAKAIATSGLRELPPVVPAPRTAPATGVREKAATAAAGEIVAADVPADTGRLIDVMILWNADARTASGSGQDANMQALATLSVTTSNQVYANSGIAQRLRLVYASSVTWTACTPSSGTAYWTCTLDALANSTGTLSTVGPTRNTHGADLVTLLVHPVASVSICGIGYVAPLDFVNDYSDAGFNVVESTCAVNNLSYPHELGHNMGATHDTYVDAETDDIKPYNHGYVNLANRWRTVMAYDDQCNDNGFSCLRLPLMSTPDFAVDTNSSDATPPAVMGDAALRNVARTLNVTAKLVASYRPTSGLHPITASFTDVPLGSSQFGAVEFMKQAGITSGCTGTAYCPDQPITRRQMAVFLERTRKAANYTPGAATGMFTDVPVDSQFAAYVEQLARDGITVGCGGGMFCPDASVTRAQMAIFLLRASCGTAYAPQPATGTMFADVAAGDVGAAQIEKMARLGATTGCATSPARYCPDTALTRGQMAVFIQRMFPFVAPSEACTP